MQVFIRALRGQMHVLRVRKAMYNTFISIYMDSCATNKKLKWAKNYHVVSSMGKHLEFLPQYLGTWSPIMAKNYHAVG